MTIKNGTMNDIPFDPPPAYSPRNVSTEIDPFRNASAPIQSSDVEINQTRNNAINAGNRAIDSKLPRKTRILLLVWLPIYLFLVNVINIYSPITYNGDLFWWHQPNYIVIIVEHILVIGVFVCISCSSKSAWLIYLLLVSWNLQLALNAYFIIYGLIRHKVRMPRVMEHMTLSPLLGNAIRYQHNIRNRQYVNELCFTAIPFAVVYSLGVYLLNRNKKFLT